MDIQHVFFIPHVFPIIFTPHWNSLVTIERISPQSPAVLINSLENEPKKRCILTAQMQKEGSDSNMEVG